MNSTFYVPAGIMWEKIGREAVVVDVARRTAWVLNSTASDIWARMCSGTPVEAIAAEFSSAGGDFKAVLTEVTGFVGELVRFGLIGSATALAYAPASPASSVSATPGATIGPESGAVGGRPAGGTTLKPAPRVRRSFPIERGPKRPHPRMGSVNPEGDFEEDI